VVQTLGTANCARGTDVGYCTCPPNAWSAPKPQSPRLFSHLLGRMSSLSSIIWSYTDPSLPLHVTCEWSNFQMTRPCTNHPSIHRSIDRSIDQYIHPSIHPSIHRSLYPFICFSLSISLSLSIYLSLSLSPSIHSSIHPSIDKSIYLFLSLSLSLSPFIHPSIYPSVNQYIHTLKPTPSTNLHRRDGKGEGVLTGALWPDCIQK
jgi:hypothetical protein